MNSYQNGANGIISIFFYNKWIMCNFRNEQIKNNECDKFYNLYINFSNKIDKKN